MSVPTAINLISGQPLKDIGYLDGDGHWTDKAAKRGIRGHGDLLRNPNAQAVAVREYFKKMEGYVRSTDAYQDVGRDIDGIKAKFPITEAGLIGAAHKEGQDMVKYYLEHQQRKGWKSDADNIDNDLDQKIQALNKYDKRSSKDKLLAVETRLRELAGIPYRAWLDH